MLPNIAITNAHLLLHLYKIFIIALVASLFGSTAYGQMTVSGTVYDLTKTIPVKEVYVKATNGNTAVSDSNGRYRIFTAKNDSLTFSYLGKPTAKFSVNQIADVANFDISLHIRVSEKFKTLKEVRVYAKNFQQDSIANREQYAKLFNYQKPGIRPTTDSYTGAAGLDLGELINIFRFKRNKQMRRMQERLQEQEQENYINYRFNKTTVKRITRLNGKDLELFMKQYRPDFEFTESSSLVGFYQYILNASYQFKRERLMHEKTTDSLLLK